MRAPAAAEAPRRWGRNYGSRTSVETETAGLGTEAGKRSAHFAAGSEELGIGMLDVGEKPGTGPVVQRQIEELNFLVQAGRSEAGRLERRLLQLVSQSPGPAWGSR